MKSKLVKAIICGLLITLSILSIFVNKSHINNKKRVQEVLNNNQVRQEQTFRVIDKSVIVNKLNLENSLNVLSGQVNTQSTYSNKDISSDDINMKWLKTKFAEWNSKDISMESKYDFMFSYSLKDLPINIRNSTVYINISPNRLSLTKCELSSVQSSERIGFLQSNFTPTEVNSLNYRNQQLAKNTVMSDEDLRFKALENVKGDIKQLLQGVVASDVSVVFTENTYDVVQQNDTVSIIQD